MVESVEQTEHRLAQLLAGVRLVCELDLEGADYADARAAMEELVKRGYAERIGSLYPATTVFYLVAEGVHRYSGGSYWPQLSVRGIDRAWMGPAFLVALERLHLPVYEEETEAGHRYVSKILLHGGLPRYCAADVLRRLIEELRWGINEARDLVNTWRRSQSRLVGVDRPAKRFLLHGEDEAVDLIDRVIDLVRTGAAGDQLDPERLGVPRYLVQEYFQLDDMEKRLTTGSRPPRPTVGIDPLSGEGPELTLPPVSSASMWKQWHVAMGGAIAGVGQVLSASEVRMQEVLLEPPGPWRAVVDGPHRRAAFEFRGVDRVPVLFFDERTGGLLREQELLRRDEVLVVAPRDTELRAGSERGEPVPQVGELPPLTGAWSRHEVRHLDLHDISQVWIGSEVAEAGLDAPSTTIRVVASTPRPVLVGAPIDGLHGPDDEAVYEAWPTVAVPAALRTHRLRYRAAVNDADELTGELSDLADPDGSVSLEKLAPGARVAKVALDVLGPLGSDLRDQRFVVISGARLTAPPAVLSPEANAELRLEAHRDVVIDGRSGGGVFPVPARVHDVSVTATDGRGAVELRVVVPRLAWAFRRLGVADVFHDECDSIGLDDMGDGNLDALLVRTRTPTRIALTLETPSGEQLQSIGPVDTQGRDGRWAFLLKRLTDSARVAGHARLHLDIVFGDDESCHVAVLHARYEVIGLAIESLTDEEAGTTLISARWAENRAFSGRQLRLWPTTRPWERPVCITVPDGARGELDTLADGTIPPGSYIAELAIADDWTPAARPRVDRSDIARVEIGTPADRRCRIATLDPTKPYEFLELLLLGELPNLQDIELPDDVLGELVIATLELLMADAKGAVTSRTLNEIRRVLFVDPDRLPDVICELHQEGLLDGTDLLRFSVVTLTDALDCPLATVGPRRRERLMSVAPVLGAALDGWPETEQSRLRWIEKLGWAPPTEGSSLPALGGPVHGFMLEWDPARVARIRDVLDIADAGLLSEDGTVDAMLSWLQDTQRQERVRRWQDAYHVFNDTRARRTDVHAKFLDAVTPSTLSPPAARFPAELLAAAIHLTGFGLQNVQAALALLSAVAIAPKLVARSLLVAIVLHRIYS